MQIYIIRPYHSLYLLGLITGNSIVLSADATIHSALAIITDNGSSLKDNKCLPRSSMHI